MTDKVCEVLLMDNTKFCFPLGTYKRLPYMIGADIVYERIKHHHRHPDEIHIDLFGLIKYYYNDHYCDDPDVQHTEQIKAFYDGDNWMRFDGQDEVIVGS